MPNFWFGSWDSNEWRSNLADKIVKVWQNLFLTLLLAISNLLEICLIEVPWRLTDGVYRLSWDTLPWRTLPCGTLPWSKWDCCLAEELLEQGVLDLLNAAHRVLKSREILVRNHSLLEFFATSVIDFTSWQQRGWFHIRRLVRLHLWTLCFPHISGPRGNDLAMCELLWKTNFAQLCRLLASLYFRNDDNCNDYQWA